MAIKCIVGLMGLMSLVLYGCTVPTPTISEPSRETLSQKEQEEKVRTEPNVPKNKESASQKEIKEEVNQKLQEQEPAPKPYHEGPKARKLQHDITQVLRKSNRDMARLLKFRVIGGNIRVYFTINDNLWGGLIKFGAKSDIVDILKTVHFSGYDYSRVTVIGTFPLVDKFGNSEESKVIQATYTSSTINRINWQGFLTDNVYDIADSVWLHPTFE